MGRSPYDGTTSVLNLPEARSRPPSPRPNSTTQTPYGSRLSLTVDPNSSSYSVVIAEPSPECASPPAAVISIPDSEIDLPLDEIPLTCTSPYAVMNRKYERTVIIKENFDSEEIINEVDPLKLFYYHKQAPYGWRPIACPEGKLYFRHEENRVLTHNDLYDQQHAESIRRLGAHIRRKLESLSEHLPDDTEIVLDINRNQEGEDDTYGYYLVSWKLQTIFWMEKVDTAEITMNERPALSDAHLRHAVLHQFWTHVEMFPNHYTPDEELLHWFRGWLTYAISDSISSETSTIPFNHDRLTDLSKLLSSIKPGEKGGYGICALAKPLKEINREHFLNFHGQPGARLNRDESVYKESLRRNRSFLFKTISLLLFHMPDVYMRHLEEVWVDNTVNYRPWTAFVTEMRRDWKQSITPATVLLSANVGFLAIQSIDTDKPDRSPAQIASYISTLLCLCNYIVCQILMRQHRHGHRELVSEAVEYLYRRDNSKGGLESVAITFSLPAALFMWSMLTFLMAMSYVCFFQTTHITQIAVGTILAFLGVMVCMVLYMDWGGVARSLDFQLGRFATSFQSLFKPLQDLWQCVFEPRKEAGFDPGPGPQQRKNSMYSVGSGSDAASTETAVSQSLQGKNFGQRLLSAWRWFGRIGSQSDEEKKRTSQV